MSSIIDQHRHLTATIRDFNQSLMATLKYSEEPLYLNPKNAVSLCFKVEDDGTVDYFTVRRPQGDYYQLACKPGVSKETAHTICEKYQIICMLC